MSNRTRSKGARRCGAVFAVGLASLAAPSFAQAAEVEPALGTAYDYSVLAGQGVTNANITFLQGYLGSSPNGAFADNGALTQTPGAQQHFADAQALQAQVDLGTGYNTARAEPSSATYTGVDLAGKNLTPGTYTWAGSITHSGGPVTLNAQGDPAARFIFQVAADMVTQTGFSVNLVNGASGCNVYWQIGNDAVIGGGNAFVGTLMAENAITVGSSTTVLGRMLARNASVTLNNNTFTNPACTRGAATTQGTPSSGTPTTPIGSPGAGNQPPPASRTTRRLRRGTSTLRRTRAPAPGATCTDGFTARVRGSFVKSVVFRLDGKRISTRRRSPFSAYVKAAGAGKHKVTAKVTYKDATRAVTRTLRYRGCAAAVLQPRRGPSQFTG